ncbi:MAG: homocitrate synthase/isopropylmalate synthase family protein, partial [Conexivisphaera sp.]
MRADGFDLDGESFERGRWVSDTYWVSHFNYDREILSRLHFPSEVVFHDVTLRDGEQTPGVVFRKDEKVEIARKLDEVGVQRIEAGMPVVSREDFEAVREIAHLGLSARVVAFSRMLREDVDAALRADVSGVITEAPVGVPKLKQFGWTYDEVVEKSVDVVSYAKAHGLWVALFGVDSTRADPEFLIRLFREVDSAAHHDSVVVADTFGCTSPEAYGKLISVIRRSIPQTIEVHTHNDFGLAVATAISGLANG